MKDLIGLESKSVLTVKEENTALFMGSGDLNVFATPALCAFVEYTCKNMISLHLEKEETSVGTRVEIDHLKATAVGMQVSCTAKIVGQTERTVDFEAEVFEGEKLIGKAKHTRAIVNTERFLSKLTKK